MTTRLVAAVALAACGSRPMKPPPVARVVAPPRAPADALLAAAAFAPIADRAERSRALFAEMTKVLLHPRCVNCHTPDETPRQGDAHELHDPPVARGAE